MQEKTLKLGSVELFPGALFPATPALWALSWQWYLWVQRKYPSEGSLCTAPVLFCGFLVLISQPVHNIWLPLSTWHRNSLLSALLLHSHGRFSQELTPQQNISWESRAAMDHCWAIIDPSTCFTGRGNRSLSPQGFAWLRVVSPLRPHCQCCPQTGTGCTQWGTPALAGIMSRICSVSGLLGSQIEIIRSHVNTSLLQTLRFREIPCSWSTAATSRVQLWLVSCLNIKWLLISYPGKLDCLSQLKAL